MTPAASTAVRTEWARRVIAEYASATYAAEFASWLLRIGASPDLVEAGLEVARQELDHARGASAIVALAGGATGPEVDAASLRLPASDDPLADLVGATVRVYCLAETTAVRLFRALRADARVPAVVELFDVIVVDEPAHAAFGWQTLDWLLDSPHEERTRDVVADRLDGWIVDLRATYTAPDAAAATAPLDRAEREWGLIDTAEYAAVVERAIDRDIVPRLARRSLGV